MARIRHIVIRAITSPHRHARATTPGDGTLGVPASATSATTPVEARALGHPPTSVGRRAEEEGTLLRGGAGSPCYSHQRHARAEAGRPDRPREQAATHAPTHRCHPGACHRDPSCGMLNRLKYRRTTMASCATDGVDPSMRQYGSRT